MSVQRFPDISQKKLPTLTADSQGGDPGLFGFMMRDPQRALVQKRSLIQWQVPHLGQNQFIEMYINPQNIAFQSRKDMQLTRTKGGFIGQYWGEALDEMTLTGVTGSAGIEGINVLRDVYRSEQLALRNILLNSGEEKRRQSLMQLAASVVMWYQGQGYRGFFTNMSYTESVNQIGVFEYTMTFNVVEIKGRRRNFLPWHRHPWSSTNTPNEYAGDVNQTYVGGGYAPGEKVGVLNAPNMTLKTVIIPSSAETKDQYSGKGIVWHVAVLRGDPRDPTTKNFGVFTSSSSGCLATQVNQRIDRAVRKASGVNEDANLAQQIAQTFGLGV